MRSPLSSLVAIAASLFALSTPAAEAELIQHDGARVRIEAMLATPQALPRAGGAAARLELALRIGAVPGIEPRRLRGIELRLSNSLRLRPGALPRCRRSQIQPSTSAAALAICGDALVGEGRFAARVLLPEQAPFPSRGRVLVFNGLYRGRAALLAHVYGTRPAPNAFTLPFLIGRGSGAFGTVLRASLPAATTASGFVRWLRISIGASDRRAAPNGFLRARCPAPAPAGSALYPLTRARLEFAGQGPMIGTLMRGCAVARAGRPDGFVR
jgi:hypothetical protein